MSGGTMNTRRIVGATLASHFAASFAALGMPPFYERILRQSLGSDAIYLAGWFFVIPTLLAALANPWWGAAADRYGKKRLLLRAHLGLALSFWLTSLAGNAWEFALGLALQGILGGTFAASNAYLATIACGSSLTRLLTLMQGSARAALFAGPALMGLLAQGAQPLVLYRYLALLPLASALLVWRLPSIEGPSIMPAKKNADADSGHSEREHITPGHLYVLQFFFIFATVMTFPYFVTYVEQGLVGLPTAAAGLLFGLPHLAYLLCALPLSRRLGQRRLLATLVSSQLLVAFTLAGQACSATLPALLLWRSAMGIGLTASYIALHGLVAAITDIGNAGRRFGSLEGSTKWGAVAAGLMAGVVVQWGLRAPFFMAAAVLALSAAHALFLMFRHSRGSFNQPARSAD